MCLGHLDKKGIKYSSSKKKFFPSKKQLEEMECYNCGKLGHLYFQCRDKKNKKKKEKKYHKNDSSDESSDVEKKKGKKQSKNKFFKKIFRSDVGDPVC